MLPDSDRMSDSSELDVRTTSCAGPGILLLSSSLKLSLFQRSGLSLPGRFFCNLLGAGWVFVADGSDTWYLFCEGSNNCGCTALA